MNKLTDLLSGYYDRGINCAGSKDMDLIEAHKWFNLASTAGDERAAMARTGVSLDMTSREIAEAQRRARAFHCAR